MDASKVSIASKFPGQARRLRGLLVITFIFLAVGLVAPIISLTKFMVIENTFSVLSGVMALLQEGQIFLFIVITAFSILLPVLKLGMLHMLLSKNAAKGDNLARYLHWMHLYGKWSMLDVFVVAVLVVAVKLGAIASVEMRYGLYAFAAAVILTMYVTSRVVSLCDSLGTELQK